MGIYRIKKETSVDQYKNDADEGVDRLEQELYATFVVLW